MLDLCAIFSRGGVLLWSKQFAPVKGDPLNALVGHIVEQRSGDTELVYKPALGGSSYSIKWTLNNKLGIVFAAVHQKSLSLPYSTDVLLSRIAKVFVLDYPDFDERSTIDFDATFESLLRDLETKKPQLGAAGALRVASDVPSHSPGRGRAGGHTEVPDKMSQAFNADLLNKKFGASRKKEAHQKAKKSAKTASAPKVKEKKARDWSALDGFRRDQEEETLEFVDGVQAQELVVESFAKASLVDADYDSDYSDYSDDSDHVAKNTDDKGDADDDRGQRSGFLRSFVRNIGMNVVGTDALKRPDIDPPLEDLKKKLMERNVAEDVANKVIESVAASLVGSKLGSFSRRSSVVRQAMEEALTRVMTPRKPIDILRGIKEAKARGRPYVISFVGVNGVGKSTSLAKVAYYLRQHDHRVMVAACDTFRSGAVEQLKVHSQRLGLDLYARGYEKDPAKVAGEAIRAAQKDGCDVVLVDTAGRMQNNEPLMRAITSLVALNNPDLVLFVGEALAGNDSVDQLVHFNKALETYSTQPNPHLIDGLIISKFETVDDKIGTAISMVFSSGAPIVFLGVGQQYTDLTKLDVRKLVRTLLI